MVTIISRIHKLQLELKRYLSLIMEDTQYRLMK